MPEELLCVCVCVCVFACVSNHRVCARVCVPAFPTTAARKPQVFVARLNRLETEQTTIRENIPPVVSAIVGVPLPPLVGEPQDWTTLNRLPVPKWAKHALKTTMPYLVTPAEIVRRKRSEQWTVDEREWRKLDLILNPHKNQDLNPEASLALANLPKYSQVNLPPFRPCPNLLSLPCALMHYLNTTLSCIAVRPGAPTGAAAARPQQSGETAPRTIAHIP